eukprot:11605780-Prorocentrum_lima.AAC.1
MCMPIFRSILPNLSAHEGPHPFPRARSPKAQTPETHPCQQTKFVTGSSRCAARLRRIRARRV